MYVYINICTHIYTVYIYIICMCVCADHRWQAHYTIWICRMRGAVRDSIVAPVWRLVPGTDSRGYRQGVAPGRIGWRVFTLSLYIYIYTHDTWSSKPLFPLLRHNYIYIDLYLYKSPLESIQWQLGKKWLVHLFIPSCWHIGLTTLLILGWRG